jgi:hypothetical protein
MDVIKVVPKMTVFGRFAPCNLPEIDQCIKGSYCLNHHGETSVNICEIIRVILLI